MPDALQWIVDPLLDWFAENRRPLPWREDATPYHVWISEIMLQQTRIEAVKRYYADFTAALPDVKALSEIPEEKLLKLWEGLGYYSRARNLRKAAKMIMEEFGGEFPSAYNEILRLPGVGEYTAGAVASICFHEKVTAVDGNVLRVMARLTGDRRNVLLPETKKDVSARLRCLLPDPPGPFNEALMELGELVCLPGGAPQCDRCPLQERCVARNEGLTDELPVRIKTAKRRQEEKTVLLITDGSDRIAIEKRSQPGLLSGMYQLPNVEGYPDEAALTEQLKAWGLDPTAISFFKKAKHVFTHIDWLMRCYEVTSATAPERFLWVTREELADDYPLPTAFKAFV